MPGPWLSQVVRRLRRADPPGDTCSDVDLLARFVRDRDEAAFELLVWRHGGMVLSACRRSLGHYQDAEDAFQATFLVLARKAGGVGRGAALPAWLHRVAVRISARAASRRRVAKPLVGDVPGPSVADPLAVSEVAALLDAEIDRLPDRLRRAVVLCYLEGLTAAEAGRRLGCPTGTVESRLATARRTLRVWLARRGVTTPVGVFAFVGGEVVLAPEAVALMARAGRAFVRGEPTAAIVGESPVRLAKGVLTMWGTRLWAGAAAVGLAVAVGAGYGWADKPGPAADEPTATATPAPPPKAADGNPAGPEKAEAWPFVRWLHGQPGRLIAVAPDGRSIVLLWEQGVYGIDLAGEKPTFQVSPPNPVADAAVSPDGKRLATAEGVNGVKIRDLPSGKLVEALWPSGKLPASRVAFTPDGSRLVVLGVKTDQPDRRGGPQGLGQPSAFTGGGPGGQPPAVATLHYQLSVWDPATWKEVGHPAVTVTGSDRTGYRIALTGGRYALLWVPQVKADDVRGGGGGAAVEPAPNGTLLTVLDTVSGASDKRFAVREGVTPAVAEARVDGGVSPDGRSVLAVDVAKPTEVIVLDAASGKERLRLAGLRRPIRAVAYSPDGRWIAAATGAPTTASKAGRGGGGPGSARFPPAEEEATGPSAVVVWDAATGREVGRMTDKETIRYYTALRFAPDGSFLVAQDAAGALAIWGHPPKPERVKAPAAEPAKQSPADAAVPDRFAALLKGLSADGVSDARRVEAVFLAALGRLPTETEVATVAAPLGRRTDKPEALRDLLYILTNTPEFKVHAAALGKLAK